MSGPIGYDDLRADTVRQVAKLMAAAAIRPRNPAANCSWPASTCSSRPSSSTTPTHSEASPAGGEPAARNARPGPGLLAVGLGGLDVEADDRRLLERASFVYDALYAWCARQVGEAA